MRCSGHKYQSVDIDWVICFYCISWLKTRLKLLRKHTKSTPATISRQKIEWKDIAVPNIRRRKRQKPHTRHKEQLTRRWRCQMLWNPCLSRSMRSPMAMRMPTAMRTLTAMQTVWHWWYDRRRRIKIPMWSQRWMSKRHAKYSDREICNFWRKPSSPPQQRPQPQKKKLLRSFSRILVIAMRLIRQQEVTKHRFVDSQFQSKF